MLKSITLVVILLISTSYSQTLKPGQVVEIIDGENLVVSTKNNGRLKVRLAGIDAPEKDQPFYGESTNNLSSMVRDKEVSIHTYKIDSLGRYVSKVLIGDQDIGLIQIRDGFAWHNRDKSESSTEEFDRYSFIESEAKSQKRGLWSGTPIEPWVWRRGATLPPPVADKPQNVIGIDPRETFIGVEATKLYYPFKCDEAKYDVRVIQRTFYSEEEAIKAGFRRSDKCTTYKPQAETQQKATLLKTARAIKIIQVTSDIEAYRRKIVTIEGEISMSTAFCCSFDETIAYSFNLSDGTDSITAYTRKSSGAAKLRSLLLARDDPRGWVKVRVEILPGSTPNRTYGLLLDFVLYSD